MNVRKIFKTLLWAQGSYTLLTALWALIDIDSFMAVAGPKTDIWLVKTVSVLLTAIGTTLILQTFINSNPLPVMLLALLTNIGLALIDLYYAFRHVISSIYLADAIVELMFFLVWLYLLRHFKKLL